MMRYAQDYIAKAWEFARTSASVAWMVLDPRRFKPEDWDWDDIDAIIYDWELNGHDK